MKYLNLKWKRPFDISQVEAVLTTLAEVRPRGTVIYEIRATGGRDIQYLIGAEDRFIYKIKQAFLPHGEVRFREVKGEHETHIAKNKKAAYSIRPHPTAARTLKVTRAKLSLNTDIGESMLRAGLATLGGLSKGETAVIQIMLGAAYSPQMVSEVSDVNASWLDIILGNVKKASSEQMKSMRSKAGKYSYDAVIRIGATGQYAESTISSLTGVFRTLSSAGVRVTSKPCDPMDIVKAKLPWQMPLRLSVTELAIMMMLPTGEDDYSGTRGIHPLELSPPEWYHPPDQEWIKREFAITPDQTGSGDIALSISPRDALEHTVILGPTGAGKSTVMLNLIMADINAGRSVIVIDPKADLVNDILARVPETRLNDLVVIDPSDEAAVGWNPLETTGKRNDTNVSFLTGENATNVSYTLKRPELIADAILAVLKDIFSENWGIRAQENLSAALLTLAEQKDATLMWLPALLTDETFRHRITKNVRDQVALKPFWQQYDAMKESERRTMIESSLNKIRQIMFRPGLRNILGQAHPKFHLSELFTKKKIVLVPLNKGLVGADSARLLGSLLVGMTWLEALGRANIPKEKRHTVSMYIDELQDYVSLPGSFADSLAQARGLGLAITVAHQYRAQLDQNLREGIDANCRNKIIFGLTGNDATSVSHLAPELQPIDFISLPRYHIYTNFMVNGKSTGWMSAITTPPSEPIRLPVEAKAISQTRYGKPSAEVEAEIIVTLYPQPSASPDDNIGITSKVLDPSGTASQIKDLDDDARYGNAHPASVGIWQADVNEQADSQNEQQDKTDGKKEGGV